MDLPRIPKPLPPLHGPVPPPPADEFSVRDALAWLGLSWETYMQALDITAGRHGNPLNFAVLDARDAQGTDTTPAQVLARHGIDPADPLAAARRYDRDRSYADDTAIEFEEWS